MSLLSKLFHYVLFSVSKYKIDESHGLSHAMDILTQANTIYEHEQLYYPQLKKDEKIIYVSSFYMICATKNIWTKIKDWTTSITIY